MRNVNRLCAVAVLIHLGVSLLHGYAHSELKVDLSSWQWYYVLGVITVAPLLGLALLWTKQRRVGLIVLAVSMAGSLIFGAYYHYVFISPDHVSHLPPGDAQGLFRMTAALLAMTELVGFIVALVGYKQIHRFPQITQISN
jgi:hypothetical protein